MALKFSLILWVLLIIHEKLLNFSYITKGIRVGMPQKYKPTKLSELPKPQKFNPQ